MCLAQMVVATFAVLSSNKLDQAHHTNASNATKLNRIAPNRIGFLKLGHSHQLQTLFGEADCALGDYGRLWFYMSDSVDRNVVMARPCG